MFIVVSSGMEEEDTKADFKDPEAVIINKGIIVVFMLVHMPVPRPSLVVLHGIQRVVA